MSNTKPSAGAMRAARRLGVTVEDHPQSQRIYADAPAGSVFSASFTHVLVADYCAGTKGEAWQDLAERLADGIEPCETADCDSCSSEQPEVER